MFHFLRIRHPRAILIYLVLVLPSLILARKSNKDVHDGTPTWFEVVINHPIIIELWHTVETFGRGFLLGFGSTILTDIVYRGKRSQEELNDTLQFGRIAGFGAACFLVGASVFIPRSWRLASF